jgi:hypothetical protein
MEKRAVEKLIFKGKLTSVASHGSGYGYGYGDGYGYGYGDGYGSGSGYGYGSGDGYGSSKDWSKAGAEVVND